MQLRQGTTVQVADRRLPGAAAMLPGQNMAAEQALIAEARARARRRRRKIALALTAAAAVLSASGVLLALTVPGRPHKVDAIAPAGPAMRSGIVTGHLTACAGMMGLPGMRPPVTPGTVTAVRGTVSNWQRPVLPGGPVAARAHISNNYHQLFRFVLSPGKYVLIGNYDGASYPPAVNVATVIQISVIAGTTLHADLPDTCQ